MVRGAQLLQRQPGTPVTRNTPSPDTATSSRSSKPPSPTTGRRRGWGLTTLHHYILLIMTLEEFRVAFKELRSRGFIPTSRRGPTGIGHTIETALGLEENNLAVPDLGKIELKAHRDESTSMITLFTFNRNAWVMPPLDAVRKYGTHDKNGRLGLYFTMSLKPNSSGLFLRVEDEQIFIQHVSGEIVVRWRSEDLADQFERKLPALILVTAQTEQRVDREYFWFYRARLLSGTSPRLIADQIRVGNILVDLRLHDAGTRARNHGTGFRTYESKLPNLFEQVEEI